MSDPRTAPQGVLELHPKGYGFLRNPKKHYAASPHDPYVSAQLIGQYRLAGGVLLGGPVEPPRKGSTGPRLAAVEQIEGADPKAFRRRVWEELTPTDPTRWVRLETGAEPLTTRVMDMFTPVGMGQRGLIVAPPRTGKTVLLAHIAAAVAQNYPDMHLMVLLVDERPEEVTDLKRSVKGEVVASSSDLDTASHVRLAELVIERGKRLVEQGRDVLVLLDSLTRLARAYNKHTGTGRTMSGGVDVKALDVPKRLFGSARAFVEGGTLTILGTALIETGSRMDEVIFQEFKGTGNMELVLNRQLAERRIYPAIDLGASGTRKEERLLPAEMLERITLLRRSLMSLRPIEAMEGLVKQLTKTQSNDEFLNTVGKFVK
ncbi:MAG: transcription termination factor Rho [Gemmataceae bacterium]|nr:transcription termination factor Rho [Gemmataceae bacterium]